jgi:hypothetical protein
MAQEQGKQKRPPYASAADLHVLFNRIEKMRAPLVIDQKWVRDYKLAAAQPAAIVSVLKWLRVIDEKGNPASADWDEVRVPATRQKKLEELVRGSYSEVFDRIDVAEASRDELHGTFVQAYGSGDPGRPVVCFVALCKHAGISTKEAAEPRPKAKAGGPKGETATGPGRRERKAATPGPKPSGGVPRGGLSPITIALNVEIPAEWSEDQIRERLAAVRRAAAVDTTNAS